MSEGRRLGHSQLALPFAVLLMVDAKTIPCSPCPATPLNRRHKRIENRPKPRASPVASAVELPKSEGDEPLEAPAVAAAFSNDDVEARPGLKETSAPVRALDLPSNGLEQGMAQEKEDRWGRSRKVTFNLQATVIPVTPYSEIYGVHPRHFDFDRSFWMVPSVASATSGPAAHVGVRVQLDLDDEGASSSSDEEAEWVEWDRTKESRAPELILPYECMGVHYG